MYYLYYSYPKYLLAKLCFVWQNRRNFVIEDIINIDETYL